jgi:hypothetical protein
MEDDDEILIICNACCNYYWDVKYPEFTRCPECSKGELVYISELDYFHSRMEYDSRVEFLDNLILKGSPNSMRSIRVHCMFTTQADAKGFVNEMQEKNVFYGSWNIGGGHGKDGIWDVTAYAQVTLKDMLLIIELIDRIIVNHNPLPSKERVTAHFT